MPHRIKFDCFNPQHRQTVEHEADCEITAWNKKYITIEKTGEKYSMLTNGRSVYIVISAIKQLC
jgi:hypothetical protein